jgi:hypothetical protein
LKQSIKVQFDYDFTLVAIVASLKQYRLTSYLNKALELQFLRTDDIQNQYNDDHEDARYARYCADDEENELSFDVISNKHENGPLIKEKKEVDFFLLVYGPKSKIKLVDLIGKINSIQNVQLAFEVDASQLKSKQNLILE